ncbi:MAG: NAD(P)/FAD-dependent oxidoreductase, partial [Candidatus Binataceae bacterium]
TSRLVEPWKNLSDMHLTVYGRFAPIRAKQRLRARHPRFASGWRLSAERSFKPTPGSAACVSWEREWLNEIQQVHRSGDRVMTTPRRVLILGGGFGGVYAALEFERRVGRHSDIEVTMVARDNYFLFTPMLHEVAASDLELTTIINPLRKLLSRVRTFVGNIESVDLARRRVAVSHGFDGHAHELPYDLLIITLGCSTNFFGLPGVEENALTVKSIGDAVALRNRLIAHLEEANSECSAGQRHPLLTFVVAGGGFAGVETLGGINDFVREALKFYPNLRAEYLRMVLVTPDEVILPELSARLGSYAQKKLAARGIEIIPRAKVTAFEDGVVNLSNGDKIPADTLIWTAGTAPNPLVASLPFPKDRGRIVVNDCLEVPGFPGVWAFGDCASVPNTTTGGTHPPTAQHALREGKAAARNVIAELDGGRKRPFRFATLGQLAAIGRRSGVANVFGVNFSGFIAWWLWRTIYLSKLPRFEKKVRVALDWTLDLMFSKDFACVTSNGRAAPAVPVTTGRALRIEKGGACGLHPAD